ncbi:phosphatase PAP2 family protein [Rhodococcus sp. NPDC003318]|uniref:phosphatase PAP2 family protein n=1 Tax=Rhodococcus sp. NPDC003318 TaxID=3364503 RepID=UPI0036C8145B
MGGDPLDQVVLDWILSWRTPWVDDLVEVITHFGDTVVAGVITVAVVVALRVRGRSVDAVMVAGAMISGYLLMSGLKLVFARGRPPRPDRLVDEITHSFPSGHAMMSAILVCVVGAALVRVMGRRSAVLFVGLALWTLVIGLSRVYLAAHWLTDVMAGWALGVAWAALWIRGTARYTRRREVARVRAAAVVRRSDDTQ